MPLESILRCWRSDTRLAVYRRSRGFLGAVLGVLRYLGDAFIGRALICVHAFMHLRSCVHASAFMRSCTCVHTFMHLRSISPHSPHTPRRPASTAGPICTERGIACWRRLARSPAPTMRRACWPRLLDGNTKRTHLAVCALACNAGSIRCCSGRS